MVSRESVCALCKERGPSAQNSECKECTHMRIYCGMNGRVEYDELLSEYKRLKTVYNKRVMKLFRDEHCVTLTPLATDDVPTWLQDEIDKITMVKSKLVELWDSEQLFYHGTLGRHVQKQWNTGQIYVPVVDAGRFSVYSDTGMVQCRNRQRFLLH